jgi:hypothetical protein
MSEIPPAFPVSTIDGYTNEGMSLRDWFAGQALPIVLDSYPEWQLKAWFGDRYGLRREEVRARAAYEFADAMLRARQGTPS